jgi:outer membrane lipoprotein carrier protein
MLPRNHAQARVKGLAVAALAAVALAGGSAARADAIEQLKAFHTTTRSGKVAFRQIIIGRAQQGQQRESTGTFAFQRPGKFRWLYEKPFEQLIVGDGDKLWVYDRDLNQVIVRKLDVALGSTPAALLAGDSALEKNFDLRDAGRGNGLDYVEAKPHSPDTGFARVKIGLSDNLPRAMELTDTFGNVTILTFSRFERNPTLDPDQFRFVPPQGADVIGEAK